jgi:hypothetical protein
MASARHELLRDGGAVVLVKALAIVLVLAAGFQAVSDDDYARVVLAERWARSPRLDPSGTSWLPAPFWVMGASLALLGRSLLVARGSAVALGLASGLVVFAAARLLAVDRRAALAGGLVAAVFPWSARLGAATVPELPAAALTLFALASCRAGVRPRVRLVGGAALLVATLSRYEPWPVAAAFAVLAVLDAVRARRGERLGLALAAPLALLGPVGWMLWNRHAHGDALHFLARVAAYSRALGGPSGGGGALERLAAYPVALVRSEPELLAVLGVAAVAAWLARRRAELARALRRDARPAALVLVQLAALAWAMVRDGAPTHHPERATLTALLLCALIAGQLGAHAAAGLGRRPAASLLGAWLPPLALVAALAVVRRPPAEAAFAQRADEVALGAGLGRLVPAGEPVLVEAVDYGHFALAAASGRPEDLVIDRDLDPRLGSAPPDSFADADALARRSEGARARWLAGRAAAGAAVVAVGGSPAFVAGGWVLWRRTGP